MYFFVSHMLYELLPFSTIESHVISTMQCSQMQKSKSREPVSSDISTSHSDKNGQPGHVPVSTTGKGTVLVPSTEIGVPVVNGVLDFFWPLRGTGLAHGATVGPGITYVDNVR